MRIFPVLQYMAKLSQDRATKEESLIEVGVCLCAVDRLLGGEETSTPKPGVAGGGSEDKAPGASSGKVLFLLLRFIESTECVCAIERG